MKKLKTKKIIDKIFKMNESEKKKEIIKIVKNILNEKIDLNSKQTSCKNWDSMANFSILSSLEKKFKIRINQRNFSKFNSIKNILKNIK
ncbi:hypothetical protein MCEMIE29_00207 [Candidatus Pelagibacterales bacterium]